MITSSAFGGRVRECLWCWGTLQSPIGSLHNRLLSFDRGFGIILFKLLTYSRKCFKQFLKVSIKLTNISHKYLRKKNTSQIELKLLKPTIVSLEGVSSSFHEQDIINVIQRSVSVQYLLKNK